MRKRIQQQTLYKKQLSSQMQPVNASDTPLTVYDIFVNTPPTYTSWWAFIEFENTDTRDLIYFHDVVGNVLKYYKKDRDLLGNGSYLLTHTSWSSIQINTNGDWINYLSSNIDDFGLVQQWYVWSSALAVKVSGWFIKVVEFKRSHQRTNPFYSIRKLYVSCKRWIKFRERD